MRVLVVSVEDNNTDVDDEIDDERLEVDDADE